MLQFKGRIMERFRTRAGRVAKVTALIVIAFVVGVQPAYPVLAEEPMDEGIYEQDPARLPGLLNEGLSYYIPGDACSVGIEPGGATTTTDGHTLPASVGGTGFEEPINAQGQVPSTGGNVTFAGNVRNASTTPIAGDPEGRSLQDLYRQYYITMRWRYVLWNWNGSSESPGPEKVDFYSKAPKVLVTNKRTGKRIIAVILEAGPAPWTGVDMGSNNNPKQGWNNPQDGTPKDYKGRVSGFPPRAIADLGATQRMQNGSGDDLVYEWAPDQNALPGPIDSVAGDAPLDNSACPTTTGPGAVNADGYAWPVADGKKHGYGGMPCTKRTCHHDGTPAADLYYGPDTDRTSNMDGKAVYAITNGTIDSLKRYNVDGCYQIQFKSDIGNGKGSYFYWYGHMQNPKVSQGQKVQAGDQIAEVAAQRFPSSCRGGTAHLHIDRGCIDRETNEPQRGGRDECRDPAFVPLLNSMWEQLK